MKHPAASIFALLAFTVAAHAQDMPQTGTPPPTAPPVVDTDTEKAGTATHQTTRNPEDERFIPSESIAEDLSVSFPSDI